MKSKGMSIKSYHKLLAVLLAASMLFASCSALSPQPTPTVSHTPGKFSEIVYARPDIDALYKSIDQALADTTAGGKEAETLKLYSDILEMILQYDKMENVAYIRHDMDLSVEMYDTESTYLDQEYFKLDNRMLELTGAILDSEYGDAARKSWGEDFVARYEIKRTLNSKEIELLSDREIELQNEYKKLNAQEYTAIFEGKTVTLDDLDTSNPAEEAVYEEIYIRRNKELGEVYRELVALRVEIAKTLGYESYADYAYTNMGRDYTKEDSQAFSAKVKELLVPLRKELTTTYRQQINEALKNTTVGLSQGIPTLQKALQEEFPPAMSEALNYMLDNEMYHFGNSANTSHGAYSTVIAVLDAPYMFVNSNDYDDPQTVYHEFGHYYNFYNAGTARWNDQSNMDLAEVHSQGLEVLMHKVYPELYGEDADLFVYNSLLYFLDSVVSGCMEDEFQQKVFENPTMSLDEMNELYSSLCMEYYGVPSLYEWVDIHHHFGLPFYYISYATSAISALEIWEIAETDRAKAMSIYDKLTQYPKNAEYRTPLKESGLSDPFTSSCVEDVAKALRTKLQLNVSSLPAASSVADQKAA